VAEEVSTEDWLELWDGLSESAKQQTQRLVEDDQLRRRAQELNLLDISLVCRARGDKRKTPLQMESSEDSAESQRRADATSTLPRSLGNLPHAAQLFVDSIA
jgi:hypothetical protein